MSFSNQFLPKVFSSLFGYKGVIDTQISVYNRLKRHMPEMPENELLNKLIASRIRAWPRVRSKEQEQEYYAQLLEDSNKSLEDVIWAIIEYEFIQSREKEAMIEGQQLGLTMDEIARVYQRAKHDFEVWMRGEIREALEQKLGKEA